MPQYKIWTMVKVPIVVDADDEYSAKCKVFSMPTDEFIDSVRDWSENIEIHSAEKLD